ncbi:MAG: carboxypeptidase-like regulatory domain-containing protein [Geothrix sp.]|nr:carboxypeptidase-like regulatory domain-containing protein [Geothrix sp.]
MAASASWRVLRPLIPAFAVAGLWAGGVPAGTTTLTEMRVNRQEEDVLLFALRLDQASLSSTFPGFAVKGGILVPLGELCRLLDLAIQSDPNRGRAEGFFIEEKRRFSLDVLAGTVAVEGRTQTFDRSQVELHADDIYVDTRLIALWLPLDLQVASRTATITVSPRVALPIQERWQRERMIGRFRTAEGPKAFPPWPDPYRLAEVPMVDETLRLTARTAPGTDQRVRAQSTTFATGDFLGLSSSLYAVLDAQDGLSEFRMTLGRRDPQAGLLGPLKATEFAFGEVLDPGLNLLSMPMAGTGALLTNYPLQRENAFDRHSFQGDLPPGWQVELYRNQALLGFQASRPDGRYEFLNVPLYYGWNDFRMVFYGPQGQRREEVARFDVSESQTPAGAFHYRVVGTDPRQAGKRGQVEGRYGISKRFTAGFSVSGLDLDGRRHTYTQANLQGFWKPLSATLTAARDQLGGAIAELGLRSRIGSTSLTVKHAELQDGFISEVFRPIYGPVRSRSSLETSTLLPSLARSLVTFDLGASQDRLVAGGSVDRLHNRISTSFHGYFFSNEIIRTEGRSAAASFPATTTGDFLASKFFRTFSLRGQANYQMDGARRLNALSAFAETPIFDPFNLRAGLTRSIVSGDTLVQLGAHKTQGAYALGLELSYSTRSRLSLDLTLRVGLAREPRSGRFHAQAQGIASHGAVSARAFLDANSNGVMDPGEKPLQGVGFMANGASQPRATDAEGVAFLTNLSGDLAANLSVSSSTLEDPLMRPGNPGLRITPRPGHVVLADVPLVLFGEVTGTAYLKRDGASRELAGLLLELVDAQGKVAKRARTAFDGFYTLSDIPPGAYQLRVPEAEIRRLGLAAPTPMSVIVTSEGTMVDGLDLVITPDLAFSPALREDVRKEE